jgi:seryl-tRNA synthetase
LELAICNWALNLVAKKGFVATSPPDIARNHIVEGCGFQPRDDSSQIYHLEGKAESLIGTAEIPLAGMYSNEILERNRLPHKMVAFSHCFRAEAGKG